MDSCSSTIALWLHTFEIELLLTVLQKQELAMKHFLLHLEGLFRFGKLHLSLFLMFTQVKLHMLPYKYVNESLHSTYK